MMKPLDLQKADTAPAWCPGCGNFPILKAFTGALAESGLDPDKTVLVSGIGQAAKLPHYVTPPCNIFNGLHGRALPAATGIKCANHELEVIVTSGDGDMYGEGGNHLIHAIRRNIGIKVFVHNNQVYGLTKGQASPTSDEGYPQYRNQLHYRQQGGRLRNVLSIKVPKIGAKTAFEVMTRLLDRHHLKQDAIQWWAVHAGGTAVLDQVGRDLGLSETALRYSLEVFHNHGNMSSPSVLFALKNIMEQGRPRSGDLGVLLTFGAGFSAFAALVEFL